MNPEAFRVHAAGPGSTGYLLPTIPETHAELEDEAVFAHRLDHSRTIGSQTRPMPGCMGLRGAGAGMDQCPTADATRDGAGSGDRSGDHYGRRTHRH